MKERTDHSFLHSKLYTKESAPENDVGRFNNWQKTTKSYTKLTIKAT